MTTLNAYATLADFKNYSADRGGNTPVNNAVDDAQIEHLLRAASDYLNDKTGKEFSPSAQILYYSVPGSRSLDPRCLELDADVLEVLSVTNGDGTAIPSTEYDLLSDLERKSNRTPYQYIRLKDTSTYYWSSNTSGNTHFVIAISAITGYHKNYTRAWQTGSTLAEDLDASETAIDVTSGSAFAAGQLVRIENELGYVSAVSSNTLTATRGENESTAATHASGTVVKIWQVWDVVRLNTLEIANNAYHRRFGQSLKSEELVTAAGIVLSPREIPHMTKEFINTFRNYL